MAISADTLQLLVDAGIAGERLVAIVRAIELDNGPSKTAGARRQREYRERLKEARDARVTSPRDVTVVTEEPTPSPLPDKRPQTPKINPTPHPHPQHTRTREGRRLDPDFVMPDDWLEWAMHERGWSRIDAESEAGGFHDHWIAKPGKDGRKLDWQATWRNWVRNSRRGSGKRSDLFGKPSGWAPRPGMAGAEPVSLDD